MRLSKQTYARLAHEILGLSRKDWEALVSLRNDLDNAYLRVKKRRNIEKPPVEKAA